MARLSVNMANRLGFIILGLANNFAYSLMLSSAYDLLKGSQGTQNTFVLTISNTTVVTDEKYCNDQSTSTILLADSLPSLSTKIVYPFLLVGVRPAYKVIATAILSALSFALTGLSKSQLLIFIGVACASFTTGLGECTFLALTPMYGDASMGGWAIGTGSSGLLGSIIYAALRMAFSVETCMLIMLIVPVTTLIAYFYLIVPCEDIMAAKAPKHSISTKLGQMTQVTSEQTSLTNQLTIGDTNQVRVYGIADWTRMGGRISVQTGSLETQPLIEGPFNWKAKFKHIPSLSKYFFPLMLVYYSEYFINQGLQELIYFPSITFLDHAAQYRWFQVTYQIGVMVSRSSLELFKIKNIWLMAVLQAVNVVIFLAHTAQWIHIPSFYLVVALIAYEGLLGGFSYSNAFYRIKNEERRDKVEFSMSTVSIADSLGIVGAGLTALPVHDALCNLYI